MDNQTGQHTHKVTVAELDQLVAEMAKKRAEIEASEAATTALNKEFMAMQAKVFHYLRELGREDFKSPNGNVSIKQVWSIVNPKTEEDKAALFDWMRMKGIYDQYATVNAASLKSLFLAERDAYLKEGGDPILFSLPGMEPAKLFETATYTKSRKS